MAKYTPDRYNDVLDDSRKHYNRIANEMVRTNALLSQLIDLYLEDNPRKETPRKETPAHVKSGAL